MIRRGFLGGLIGAIGAAKVAPARASEIESATHISDGEIVGSMLQEAAVPVPDKNWEILSRLYKPYESKMRRRRTQIVLLHGHWPGIDSNHSWAPWFKAQASAKRIQKFQEDDASTWEKLRAWVEKGGS